MQFERVRCNCPPYKGSDFWNDPHRWCGVDPPSEAFWMKDGVAACERTVRPVKTPAPVMQHQLDNRALSNLIAQQNMLSQMAYRQTSVSSLLGIGFLGL